MRKIYSFIAVLAFLLFGALIRAPGALAFTPPPPGPGESQDSDYTNAPVSNTFPERGRDYVQVSMSSRPQSDGSGRIVTGWWAWGEGDLETNFPGCIRNPEVIFKNGNGVIVKRFAPDFMGDDCMILGTNDFNVATACTTVRFKGELRRDGDPNYDFNVGVTRCNN